MAVVAIGIVLFFSEEHVNNDRIKLFPGNFSYCQAHKMCFEEGQKMGLLGLVIGEEISNHRVKYLENLPSWTRIHSLLCDVWINGDCGKSVNESHVNKKIWKDGGIEQFNRRVTVYALEGLYTVPQNNSIFPCICEFYEAAVPRKSSDKFEFEPYVKDWPIEMKGLMAGADDEDHGCFENARTETLVACGFRCQQLLYCRAIYYNEKKKQCKLALFVDARMPYDQNTSPSDWVRFARREWGKRLTV